MSGNLQKIFGLKFLASMFLMRRSRFQRCINIVVDLVLVFGAASGWAQVRPGDADTSSAIPLKGVLSVSSESRDCELCKVSWEAGLQVAQDKKDRIFILHPDSGECRVYSTKGEKLEVFKVNDWKPLNSNGFLSPFALSSAGDEFVAGSGNRVSLFSSEKVEFSTTLPIFITSLAFSRDIILARFPVDIRPEKGQLSITRNPYLLQWLESDGSPGAEALPADPARGPDPMSIAMTQGVEIAADSDGTLWVMDQTRLYRVRRLSRTGRVLATWVSDRLNSAVGFSGETPDEAKETGAESFTPVHAPRIVVDSVARDGLLWVLVNASESQMVDVFEADLKGPVARFTLPKKTWRYWQLAVASDSVWLFPANKEGAALQLERPQDWEILQEEYAKAPVTVR